jgi:hypothetical protein
MSTVAINAPEQVANLSVVELEALIRRIVRDEIERALASWELDEEPTIIEPGSPLYENMMDIQHRAQEGKLKFYTHEEVWGDEPV